MRDCPYGGTCIDPGNPSDCFINDTCANFASKEEKARFDALPDAFYFQYPNGEKILFKNLTQLEFLLADLHREIKAKSSWGGCL